VRHFKDSNGAAKTMSRQSIPARGPFFFRILFALQTETGYVVLRKKLLPFSRKGPQ